MRSAAPREGALPGSLPTPAGIPTRPPMAHGPTSHRVLDRLLWPLRDAEGGFQAGWLAGADILVWALWLGTLQLFIHMPPAAGLVWILIAGSAFLWRYTLSEALSGSRRHVSLETGSGGAPPRRVLLAALAFAGFGVFWRAVYEGIPGVPPALPPSWAGYAESAAGVAVTAIVLLLLGPIMEEFCFRGWVMPALTSRYGAGTGLFVSSLLFGFLHAGPLRAPYYVAAGLALAASVHVTGSVWVGVVLHAGYNAAALAVDASYPAPQLLARMIESLGDGSWSAPLGLMVTAVTLAWSLARLVPRAHGPVRCR